MHTNQTNIRIVDLTVDATNRLFQKLVNEISDEINKNPDEKSEPNKSALNQLARIITKTYHANNKALTNNFRDFANVLDVNRAIARKWNMIASELSSSNGHTDTVKAILDKANPLNNNSNNTSNADLAIIFLIQEAEKTYTEFKKANNNGQAEMEKTCWPNTSKPSATQKLRKKIWDKQKRLFAKVPNQSTTKQFSNASYNNLDWGLLTNEFEIPLNTDIQKLRAIIGRFCLEIDKKLDKEFDKNTLDLAQLTKTLGEFIPDLSKQSLKHDRSASKVVKAIKLWFITELKKDYKEIIIEDYRNSQQTQHRNNHGPT